MNARSVLTGTLLSVAFVVGGAGCQASSDPHDKGSLRYDFDQMKRENDARQQVLQDEQSRLGQARTENASLAQRREQAQNNLKKAQIRLGLINKDVARLESELATLTQRLGGVNQGVLDAQRNLSGVQSRSDTLQKSMNPDIRTAENPDQTVDQLILKIGELTSDVNQLRKQVNLLQATSP